MTHEFQNDIDAIARIDAIPTILDVVCQVTGLRFAAVARVTEDRWITCKVLDLVAFGLKPGDELKVESTICHEIRQNREPVIIDNVAESACYKDHHTPALYGFLSYISMPIIRKNGEFFGTLCALDPEPAQLQNSKIIGMFKLFAELIATHLDSDVKLAKAQADLRSERETANLREQFIAVLGHDLRNPLASIDAGARMILRSSPDDKSQKILQLMQGSILRMSGLIDNVLDFAKARLGDGLDLNIKTNVALTPALEQVVSELRTASLGREIITDFQSSDPVPVDHARICQMFSNLLGNAITHGAEDTPIYVGTKSDENEFTLWVENFGDPIAPEAHDKLFQPFFRGHVRPSKQGLGLGLFIAAEIARVHGGTLKAKSDEQSTRLTFRMPLHR